MESTLAYELQVSCIYGTEHQAMMSELAAEYGRKLERMQSKYKRLLVKQDSERKMKDAAATVAEDDKHRAVTRSFKASETV